ncbi:MAG TPA: prenyltransferase/squalene oxidase repeat-containing protein [Urbifossiella sp.]|jgi:squalene-hopene/tetraprenyl-beta-curcumene cyclase|nr:prenyltransferase/squalene oxidase repeat-containing protein [Urbifossiella sp.]
MTPLTRRAWLQAAAASPVLLAARPASAAPVTADEKKAVIDKAAAFLKTRQKDNGDLAPDPRVGPGVTALAVAALVRNGVPATDDVVAKGLKFLEGNIKPDGGVYSQGLATYTTSLAILAFRDTNTGGRYDKVIAAATGYVKTLQFGGDPARDARVGGAGYGNPGGRDRPDLSNTNFMVEAMIAAGVSRDDPAIRNAIGFVSRSQNLASEYNTQPFATRTTDADRGGFVYALGDQDNEKSDKRTPNGGLRSEGGMTYAGLKSFLYAGVGKDDPRVKAAVAWIKRNYTLTENPGMGQAGLFYYYHTFAKAMDALGEEEFEDARMVKHEWRRELFEELKRRQRADGSWVNENRAFMENAPELATAFAVLSLSYTIRRPA